MSHHGPYACRDYQADLDPASASAWHTTVRSMRTSIGAWLSKGSKHAMVAYPLLTQLLCLESDDAFLQGINPLLDSLQKLLKVGPFRGSDCCLPSTSTCQSESLNHLWLTYL